MNKDNFVVLIDHAASTFRLSFQETKSKFSNRPFCIIFLVEKEKKDPVIEVRFDKEMATISYFFDEQHECDMITLFFDAQEDEDLFIEYLNEISEYDYRKKCWETSQFWVRLETRDDNNAFLFYI